MLRFICFLLGKPYETCKSCETLKQQLAIANEERQRLTDTLLEIIKPKVVEAPPQEIQPIVSTSGLFSRRRAALEERDRQEAKIKAEGKHLGKPDDELKKINFITPATKSVEDLEKELGVEEENQQNG